MIVIYTCKGIYLVHQMLNCFYSDAGSGREAIDGKCSIMKQQLAF